MTSKTTVATHLASANLAEALTNDTDDDEPPTEEAARLNKFLGEAIDACEVEFGTFTEDELAQARSEMGR